MLIFSKNEPLDNQSKLEILYTQYREIHTAFKVLNDVHAAEDVVHQAFMRIMNGNLDKINLSECRKTKAYLVIITENIAIDLYRKRQREKNVSYEEAQFLFINAHSAAFDFSHELDTSFNKMQTEYASILILKYYYGYSTKEISKMLGLTEVNTRKRLSRAKKQLAQILKEERGLT